MKVVTYHDDSIAAIRESVEYESNGNVLIGNNQGIGAWLVKEVYDVEEVPEGVEEYKNCYTEEKGFYKNENYTEPVNEEDRFTDIELALAEIYEMITEGGK